MKTDKKERAKYFCGKLTFKKHNRKEEATAKDLKNLTRGKRLDGKRKWSVEHVATFQTYLYLLACLRSELINKSV